jgi:hypothetical protein
VKPSCRPLAAPSGPIQIQIWAPYIFSSICCAHIYLDPSGSVNLVLRGPCGSALLPNPLILHIGRPNYHDGRSIYGHRPQPITLRSLEISFSKGAAVYSTRPAPLGAPSKGGRSGAPGVSNRLDHLRYIGRSYHSEGHRSSCNNTIGL